MSTRKFGSAVLAVLVAALMGLVFAPVATAGGGSDACAPYSVNSWPIDTVEKSGKSNYFLANSGVGGVALTVGKSTLTVTSAGEYPAELIVVLGGTKVYSGTSTSITFPKTALNNKQKVAFICGNSTVPPPPAPVQYNCTVFGTNDLGAVSDFGLVTPRTDQSGGTSYESLAVNVDPGAGWSLPFAAGPIDQGVTQDYSVDYHYYSYDANGNPVPEYGTVVSGTFSPEAPPANITCTVL